LGTFTKISEDHQFGATIVRSRADLGPNYGNTLIKRCFWEKENPYENSKGANAALSLRT